MIVAIVYAGSIVSTYRNRKIEGRVVWGFSMFGEGKLCIGWQTIYRCTYIQSSFTQFAGELFKKAKNDFFDLLLQHFA